jgi:hypothetical protein
VLCTLAQKKIREEWTRDRDRLTQSLRRSLADAEGQEREVQENATRQATLLGLEEPERAVFIERYRERRLHRIAEGRMAIEAQPPDYAALLSAVKGLFADEDALAREIAGESGRERLRAAELESRTLVLAIGVSLADLPYSAVRW